MKRLGETKNEKIALINASISAFIFIVVNTVTNIWEPIGTKISMDLNKILLIILNGIGISIIYLIVSWMHYLLWRKVLHKNYNLTDNKWYGIQIDENDGCYFRLTDISITQNYYNVHIVADAYNIVYNLDNDTIKRDNKYDQPSRWTYDGVILEDKESLEGIFNATRSDNLSRTGFLDFSLMNYKKGSKDANNNDPDIAGWFIDIGKGTSSIPRNGKNCLFTDKNKRDNFAKEFCSARCKEQGKRIYKSRIAPIQSPSQNEREVPKTGIEATQIKNQQDKKRKCP